MARDASYAILIGCVAILVVGGVITGQVLVWGAGVVLLIGMLKGA
jgi:hypothetical protein